MLNKACCGGGRGDHSEVFSSRERGVNQHGVSPQSKCIKIRVINFRNCQISIQRRVRYDPLHNAVLQEHKHTDETRLCFSVWLSTF